VHLRTATVATLQDLLNTYLVFNWIGFRNISQMILEGDKMSNNAFCTIFSNARKRSRHFIGNALWVKGFSDLHLVRIVHTDAKDLASNSLTKRVTEEEQAWSSDDMRGAVRRFSKVDALSLVPIMKSDHEARWPLILCSATADYHK
jgi:hypothetical protein